MSMNININQEKFMFTSTATTKLISMSIDAVINMAPLTRSRCRYPWRRTILQKTDCITGKNIEAEVKRYFLAGILMLPFLHHS